MTFLELTNEERSRLKNLNNDKATVFALKKLFLNVCAEGSLNTDVNTLAAERVALEYIKKSFYDLNIIKPEDGREIEQENPAV